MSTLTIDNTWMHSPHYHCRNCGAEIKCWKGIEWKVGIGVRRIGGCSPCGLLMVEYERNRKPEWVCLPKV